MLLGRSSFFGFAGAFWDSATPACRDVVGVAVEGAGFACFDSGAVARAVPAGAFAPSPPDRTGVFCASVTPACVFAGAGFC